MSDKSAASPTQRNLHSAPFTLHHEPLVMHLPHTHCQLAQGVCTYSGSASHIASHCQVEGSYFRCVDFCIA